jgi:hypothetical protein
MSKDFREPSCVQLFMNPVTGHFESQAEIDAAKGANAYRVAVLEFTLRAIASKAQSASYPASLIDEKGVALLEIRAMAEAALLPQTTRQLSSTSPSSEEKAER